jgi:hypothetical protein
MTDPVQPRELRIVPADHATWQDLEAIFGTADYPFHGRARCGEEMRVVAVSGLT